MVRHLTAKEVESVFGMRGCIFCKGILFTEVEIDSVWKSFECMRCGAVFELSRFSEGGVLVSNPTRPYVVPSLEKVRHGWRSWRIWKLFKGWR